MQTLTHQFDGQGLIAATCLWLNARPDATQGNQ